MRIQLVQNQQMQNRQRFGAYGDITTRMPRAYKECGFSLPKTILEDDSPNVINVLIMLKNSVKFFLGIDRPEIYESFANTRHLRSSRGDTLVLVKEFLDEVERTVGILLNHGDGGRTTLFRSNFEFSPNPTETDKLFDEVTKAYDEKAIHPHKQEDSITSIAL